MEDRESEARGRTASAPPNEALNLKAMCVRATFDGEDDGDHPKHEQALASWANHRAHAWCTRPVFDDCIRRVGRRVDVDR